MAVNRPGKLRWAVKFPARAQQAWDLYQMGTTHSEISKEVAAPRSVLHEMFHTAGGWRVALLGPDSPRTWYQFSG